MKHATISRLTVHWLNNDIRLHDNPALTGAVASDALVIVYCLDTRWLKSDKAGMVRLGPHRLQWLQHTLTRFDRQLRLHGQQLFVLWGDPVSQLAAVVNSLGADRVTCTAMAGWEERQQWAALKLAVPGVQLETIGGNTLYTADTVDDRARAGFPTSYSQFRKRLEAQRFRAPVDTLTRLAALPPNTPDWLRANSCPTLAETDDPRVGESAALEHLAGYLDQDHVASYKATRNALEGAHYSSGVSLWLANGTLSVCTVASELEQYEARNGSNPGSTWLRFELLWREYFHWYAIHHGAKLFRFTGIGEQKPLTSFYPERFRRWCEGNTPWPLVNACMRCLRQTGLLSNRGRQIAASALVHELAVDWRYGAAWFEQHLLDYDVASNWGNWQYIAGVGSRSGGSHFDIDEQARRFDPDRAYTSRWASGAANPRIDSVDAADWPML